MTGEPLMTPLQAAACAEDLLRQTADIMDPRPRLEPAGFFNGISPCPDDDSLVTASRTYWLRGITEQDNTAIGEQVLPYWTRLGWTITSTTGIGTTSPVITAIAPPYAFSVSLESSANGWLSIGATSVCLPRDNPPDAGR